MYSKDYNLGESSMWPFCDLLSKLLGIDAQYDEQPEEYHLGLHKSFPFRHLTRSGNYGTPLLPHSHFVDVSIFDCIDSLPI